MRVEPYATGAFTRKTKRATSHTCHHVKMQERTAMCIPERRPSPETGHTGTGIACFTKVHFTPLHL